MYDYVKKFLIMSLLDIVLEEWIWFYNRKHKFIQTIGTVSHSYKCMLSAPLEVLLCFISKTVFARLHRVTWTAVNSSCCYICYIMIKVADVMWRINLCCLLWQCHDNFRVIRFKRRTILRTIFSTEILYFTVHNCPPE